MVDTKISALPAVTTPAATDEFAVNQGGTSKKMTLKQVNSVRGGDFSTAAQSISANTDTYITNSGILIPAEGMTAGDTFRWYLGVTKTAAGIAAAVWTFRIGTARTTADTSRLAITSTAQVATASGTLIIVTLQVRAVGSGTTGSVVGQINTGAASFGIGGNGVSAGFANNALAANYVGLSVNTGASGAWTVNSVDCQLAP
jgi:hypothetical protein